MKISRGRPEQITGQPEIHIRRPYFWNLIRWPSRPIVLDALDDQSLLRDRLWSLMMDRFEEAVAQFGEGKLALRPINLPLRVFEPCQLPTSNIAICGL